MRSGAIQRNVGQLISEPFEGGFEFDTGETGNGNGGHPFGTELDAEQRATLHEHLESL